MNTVLECLYMFLVEKRGHQLSTYATLDRMEGLTAAYRRRVCHAQCVRTNLHFLNLNLHLSSCFWQYSCLIVPSFISRNLALTLLRKMCSSGAVLFP